MVVLNRVLCTGGPLCTPTLSVSSPLQCRVFSECFGGCQIGYLPRICCYLLHSQKYHKPSQPLESIFKSLVSNSLLDDDYI